MSQTFYLGPTSNFVKSRKLFTKIFPFFVLKLTTTFMNNLRHSSLQMNVPLENYKYVLS